MEERIKSPENITSPEQILDYFIAESKANQGFTNSNTLLRNKKDRDKDVSDTEYMSLAAGSAFKAILEIAGEVKDPKILAAFESFVGEYFLRGGGINSLDNLYKIALREDRHALHSEMEKSFTFLYDKFRKIFEKTYRGTIPNLTDTTRETVNKSLQEAVGQDFIGPPSPIPSAQARVEKHLRETTARGYSARSVRGGDVSPK